MQKWRINSKWRKRRDNLLQIIKLPDQGFTLDQSCGNGQFLELIHKMRSNLQLFGIDIDKENIDGAKKEYKWGNFSVQNSYALDFSDNKFDLIFCNMALHHYEDPVRMLRESKRVMKKKGSIYILDIFPENKIIQFFYNLKGCNDNSYFEKYYTVKELQKLVSFCDLTIKEQKTISFIPKLHVIELKNKF